VNGTSNKVNDISNKVDSTSNKGNGTSNIVDVQKLITNMDPQERQSLLYWTCPCPWSYLCGCCSCSWFWSYFSRLISQKCSRLVLFFKVDLPEMFQQKGPNVDISKKPSPTALIHHPYPFQLFNITKPTNTIQSNTTNINTLNSVSKTKKLWTRTHYWLYVWMQPISIFF